MKVGGRGIPRDTWPQRALTASLCGRSVFYLSQRGAQRLISKENLDVRKRQCAWSMASNALENLAPYPPSPGAFSGEGIGSSRFT
jgi:hypothetical protein